MWNLCRSAALQHLQRATTAATQRLAVQSMVLHASSAGLSSNFIGSNYAHRSFATSSSMAGVEMSHLLNSSPKELASELGKNKIMQVQRSLKQEFADVAAKPQEDVSSEDVVQLFSAAQKTRLPALMLHTFAYMQEHFPAKIDFVMYGEIFRALARERAGDKLWAIFEFARDQFTQGIPELIYRFGIVGKIELGEMDAAEQLLEQMKNDGHFVTNEIYSRLIGGYARDHNLDKVLEYYDKLDPRMGQWHESTIDRVILSLGVAGKADLAFEFYVNTNMKLNGGTLITLLSVCRHNDCFQQASDILENRTRFNLKLDARAYNGILETLVFLDRRGDILAVLEEMNDEGVRFDTLTKMIVERNQAHLKDTYFDLSTARQRSGYDASNSNSNNTRDRDNKPQRSRNGKDSNKVKAYLSSPELKSFLQEKNFVEAARIAFELVRPMAVADLAESKRSESDEQDQELVAQALSVQPSIAKEVVSAFIGNGDVDKIAALLTGFELTESRVGFALMEIVNQYSHEDSKRGNYTNNSKGNNKGNKTKRVSKKQRELAYRAAKLLLLQDWQIHRASSALHTFREFKDVDAVRQLCEQVLTTYAAQSGNDEHRKVSGVSVSQTLSWTLRIMTENYALASALELLETAQQGGFRIEPSHYIGLLSGMREHSAHTVKQKGVVVLAENYKKKPFYYLSDPFEKVMDDIDARGVRLTRGIVANACFAMAGGNRSQRLRLLEAYAGARSNATSSTDSFEMPTVVYSALMHVCGKETNDMDELKQIYADALASLPSDKDSTMGKRVPLDWEVIVISHLADAGHVDEAFERLQNMKEMCGTYSYEATVKVLRGSLAVKNASLAKRTAALLEQRNFKPTLSDTYDIVHLARDNDMPHVAFEVVTQYERAHGRATEDAVDHAKSRQSLRDKFAVRKIRSMYRVVLKLCEQNGEWKRALAFSTRVNELLRFEDAEGAVEGADDAALEHTPTRNGSNKDSKQ